MKAPKNKSDAELTIKERIGKLSDKLTLLIAIKKQKDNFHLN